MINIYIFLKCGIRYVLFIEFCIYLKFNIIYWVSEWIKYYKFYGMVIKILWCIDFKFCIKMFNLEIILILSKWKIFDRNMSNKIENKYRDWEIGML